MSKEFLPTILKQKEQEVAAMSYEELQPLRSTYWEILILLWILWSRLAPMNDAVQL